MGRKEEERESRARKQSVLSLWVLLYGMGRRPGSGWLYIAPGDDEDRVPILSGMRSYRDTRAIYF